MRIYKSRGLCELVNYCCDIINGKIKVSLNPFRLLSEQNEDFKKRLAEEMARCIKSEILPTRKHGKRKVRD